jgi:hypothetical protein
MDRPLRLITSSPVDRLARTVEALPNHSKARARLDALAPA